MGFSLYQIIVLLLLSLQIMGYDVSPTPPPPTSTRQSFLRHTMTSFLKCTATATILFIPSASCHAAAETIGKDPNCQDASCLGVWDGLLANCDHGGGGGSIQKMTIRTTAGCVSSQDDTPGTFAEPWDYSDDSTIATITTNSTSSDQSVPQIMERMIQAIQSVSNRRGDTVEIVWQQQRYLRVLFTDQQSGETSDGEFYITPNDTTIQFRLSSTTTQPQPRRTGSTTTTAADDRIKVGSRRRPFMNQSSFKNIDRAEWIRRELKWLKLPILRNRQRALFFVESGFDTFGPQSAALGPPEEMKINDLYHRN